MQNNASDPIEQVVLDALKSSVVDATSITLIGQMDRKLYTLVNEAIVRIGGKWNKKARKHLFDNDPRPLFFQMLETGRMPLKNPTAYFPTPDALASRMVALIPPSARTVLEPSAGTGHIARAIRSALPEATLHCCEVLPAFRDTLHEQGFVVVAGDFVTYRPDHGYYRPDYGYDAIVMNPPFSLETDRMAYVTHIMHAWSLLNPGGALIAIAPAGLSNQDKRVKALNALIKAHGSCEELGSGVFKESGTGVSTVLITLTKKEASKEHVSSEMDNQTSERTEEVSGWRAEPDFHKRMLALTKELNQLEEEAREIHRQINLQISALFPQDK